MSPLGGRLPLADPATLTPAQRELYDQLIGSWVVFTDKLGIRSTTEDGCLIGPFNALLLHPEVTAKLLEFQVAESANTSLSLGVREVVIIVLGAVYGADYELYAHKSVARTAGLADDHVPRPLRRKHPGRPGRAREARCTAHLRNGNASPHRRRVVSGGRVGFRSERPVRHRRRDGRLPHGVHHAHPVRGAGSVVPRASGVRATHAGCPFLTEHQGPGHEHHDLRLE